MDEEYCNSNSNTFLKIDGTSFFYFYLQNNAYAIL